MVRWAAALVMAGLLATFGARADWEIEIVDSEGDVGRACSMAIDSQGRPHLSYFDQTDGDLKYAVKGSSGWQVTIVDGEGNVGDGTDLVLDPSGLAHISYHSLDLDRVKYARWDGSIWQIEWVDANPGGVTGTWMALDLDGQPHIAYHSANRLIYSHREEQGWVRSIFPGEGDLGFHCSLAFDSQDRLHLASLRWQGCCSGNLLYAVREGADWVVTYLMGVSDTCEWPQLVLDPLDHPHIAFYEQPTGDMKYSFSEGGPIWTSQIVESARDVGLYPSLALDPHGRPHVSYMDQTEYDLRYAMAEDGHWTGEAVDVEEVVGYNTSLALDQAGAVWIAYFDGTNADLKLAHRPYATPVPLPTSSPTATATPAPTASMTATPTATPVIEGVDLILPRSYFHPGDVLRLEAALGNPGPGETGAPLAIMLEVHGDYWFWPSWTRFDPETGCGVDLGYVDLAPGITTVVAIEPLAWPETGGEVVAGLFFRGALLTEDLTAIRGRWDTEAWGYGP